MDVFTYRIVSLAMVLMSLTGFGSGLRVVQKPQPFTFSTEELNISCIVDEPAYTTKSILSIQITRHIQDKPIAIVNVAQELKMAVGIKDNVKAEGHIDKKSNKSYLTLIIDKPGRQDAGTYRCQMFVIDENVQLVEKNVIGNVTYQESEITGVVTSQARKLSNLLKRVLKQNNTLQTLKKQHTTFKDFHSEQKLNMDILNGKIDVQNNTNTQQNKQLEELKLKHKQDMDILTHEMKRQNKTNMKLTEKIDTLNKDNTRKQQELETLTDYIKQLNKTIRNQRVFLTEWSYYEADKTFNKVFGKGDNSKYMSWSKAREACRMFGGDLVQIRDEAKNNFVYNLIRGASSCTWIGIKNQATTGYVFKYVDGSDLGSYHAWSSGEPNNSGDNDHKCVCMYPGVNARKWDDNTCSYPRHYVCSTSSLNVV